MSEQTTPASAGDETVAAANAPLSEAEQEIIDPETGIASPEDETSESTSSEEEDELEASEVAGTAPVEDVGDSDAATPGEALMPADQEAVVEHAGISDSAERFIAEAWAPDDKAPVPSSASAPESTAEVAPEPVVEQASGTPDSTDAAPEDMMEIVEEAGISESAEEFIAPAWAPDDRAAPAEVEKIAAEPSTEEAAGESADAMPEPMAAIVEEAEISKSAERFIAEAWAPDDDPQQAGEEHEAVGQEATAAEAGDEPPADGDDVQASTESIAAEPATVVEVTGDADATPEFDGGEVVAEAFDQEPAEDGAAQGESQNSVAVAAADAPEAAAEAPSAGIDGASADVAIEAPSEETAADRRAETVLAADAIAASAIASSEQAEQEAEAEAAPVVVDRELAWGFVDTEGRIHQKTTEHFRGRPIGRIIGSGDLQIAELESNFGPLEKDVEALEAEVESAKNKVAVMGKVRKMKSTAGRAEALGDFDSLFVRLHALEATIQEEIDERRAKKEALIERAEEMKESTDWKVTGEAYKELFQEWKQVGATGREADDALWARFIGAREHFNTRRGEHFNQRQEQWEDNRLLKQEVIVRAHELSTSDQWRPTSDAMRALFDEWKKIGSAGRQSDEELWQQFRGAQQHFYDRRNAAYDENRQRKELLCQRAEDLRESTDWNATVEEMKAMMADWKSIGTSGKRDVDDALWNRFRGAQNAFFDKRYAEASAREQQERSQSLRKEEIAAAIEQLVYSSDAVAASEQALELRAQFEALPPIRRDREEQLERRIRKAMGDIRVNAAAEGARRAVSWQGKLREALERSQGQIESLTQTVAGQEKSLEEVRAQLESASPDEKPALEQQVQELYEGISYNQAEIERLKGSMSEISDNVQV